MINDFAAWFAALSIPEQVVAVAFALIGSAFVVNTLDRR